MNDVKTFLQTAHADAKALEAELTAELDKLRAHIASIVAALGFDPATLELTDVQPADQAAT